MKFIEKSLKHIETHQNFFFNFCNGGHWFVKIQESHQIHWSFIVMLVLGWLLELKSSPMLSHFLCKGHYNSKVFRCHIFLQWSSKLQNLWLLLSLYFLFIVTVTLKPLPNCKFHIIFLYIECPILLKTTHLSSFVFISQASFVSAKLDSIIWCEGTHKFTTKANIVN